jgi:arylsulfatase
LTNSDGLLNRKLPNILLLFPDQHRGDWTEFNPAIPVRTPNLKFLGENGVEFTNAITPSPLCSPARSCLASGREYDYCNIVDNGQNHPLEETSFYKLLQNAGYHTMACGKFDLNKPRYSYGKDGKQIYEGVNYFDSWGFSDGLDNGGKHNSIICYTKKGKWCPYLYYLDQKGVLQDHLNDFKSQNAYLREDPTPLSDEDYADNWIGRNGLALLLSVPKEKPWFLQVNFNGPHDPMDVTKSMRDKWKNINNFPPPNKCTRFNNEQNQRIRQNYSAMIENIDRWTGIFIDELKKRGEFENTIIVYSSDHGEMLGDHNRVAKGVPYQPAVNVPLVIRIPNNSNKKIINQPTKLIDLAATFLDFAGIKVPDYMDSRSLRPLLEGKTESVASIVISGLRHWRMAFDGRYKLIIGFEPGDVKTLIERLKQKILKKKHLQSSSVSKSETDRDKNKKIIKNTPVLLFDLVNDPLENHNIAIDHPDIVEKLLNEIKKTSSSL